MNPAPFVIAALNSSDALIAFIVYSVAVLGIAVASHFVLSRSHFMSEYFLGSRSLGVWALMLTFAATSASAGSFAGFPALIYSHGWVLALWIAGYMVVPIVAMGLLGKRINRVARQANAITLPEMMSARFDSRWVSMVATLLIVSLMLLYLIPQFKIASIILQELLAEVPLWQSSVIVTENLTSQLPLVSHAEPAYLLGLFLFSIMVIAYTSFGGFRAVVWTDMLQGAAMFFGVIVLFILTLYQTGGLKNATEQLWELTPPEMVLAEFRGSDKLTENEQLIPSESWFVITEKESSRLFRTNEVVTLPTGQEASKAAKAVEIVGEFERKLLLQKIEDGKIQILPNDVKIKILKSKSYDYGANQKGVYVMAPGPSESDANGFLPFTIAISFFIFWTLGGAGQPGNKVRLMAFENTKTLKRAMALLTIYFGVIYLSLVVIFCCGRLLVPGLDQTPDRIMPVLSLTVANNAGVPWLAGLLIAAPFAAAMSTVDSFMLMISSSLVRDVYQKEINPEVTEKTTKRLSYLCTMTVGLLVMFAAVNPPKFLQVIIVFASGGLASVFLVPVFLGLFWPRFNAPGAIAGMLGGFSSCMSLYVIGFIQNLMAGITSLGDIKPYRPLEFDPLIWGILGSILFSISVCLLTSPPSRENVKKFFGK